VLHWLLPAAPTSRPKLQHQTQQHGDGLICLIHEASAYDTDDGVSVGDDGADGRRDCPGLGLLGCSIHSIDEGNTIGRAVAVGGLLVMPVGIIFELCTNDD
jgi:hypothetical protein